MTSMSICDAAAGMVLAQAVNGAEGLVLLPAGTRLTEVILQRLGRLGVRRLTIQADAAAAAAGQEQALRQFAAGFLHGGGGVEMAEIRRVALRHARQRYGLPEGAVPETELSPVPAPVGPHHGDGSPPLAGPPPDRRLETITARLTRLPTLPRHARELMRLLERPDAPIESLRRTIEKDLGLAAAILRLVNSGYYGLAHTVTTLPQAIVLLGFAAVKSLVLSASAASVLQEGGAGLYEHSLACARAAQVLSDQLAVGEPEECYTAGLLHDAGKIIVNGYLPMEGARIRALIQAGNRPAHDAERLVLGSSHAGIGAWLLRKWELPASIVDAVAAHHEVAPAAPWSPMAALIHLADVLVRAEGFVWHGDALVPPPAAGALAVLSIDLVDLEPLMTLLAARLTDTPRPDAGRAPAAAGSTATPS